MSSVQQVSFPSLFVLPHSFLTVWLTRFSPPCCMFSLASVSLRNVPEGLFFFKCCKFQWSKKMFYSKGSACIADTHKFQIFSFLWECSLCRCRKQAANTCLESFPLQLWCQPQMPTFFRHIVFRNDHWLCLWQQMERSRLQLFYTEATEQMDLGPISYFSSCGPLMTCAVLCTVYQNQ